VLMKRPGLLTSVSNPNLDDPYRIISGVRYRVLTRVACFYVGTRTVARDFLVGSFFMYPTYVSLRLILAKNAKSLISLESRRRIAVCRRRDSLS